MIPETRKRFERLVKATGAASEETLALVAAEESVCVPAMLVERYGCDKTRILQILAEVYRMPSVDLATAQLEKSLLKEARMAMWRRGRAAPMREEEGHVLVAIADPEDLATVDAIQAVLGKPLRVHVALANEIEQYLDDWGGKVSVGTLVSELAGEEKAEVPAVATPGHPHLRITSQSEAGSPPVRLVDGILAEALERGATEVYLLVMPDGKAHARMQVKRKMIERRAYARSLHANVVNRLRALADLVGKDKRVPQSGAFLTMVKGAKHRVDALIMPAELGEAVTLFIDREDVAGELSGADPKHGGD